MGVDILGPTFTTHWLSPPNLVWMLIESEKQDPWWTDAGRAHSSLATDTNSGNTQDAALPDAWHFLGPFHLGPKMIPPHLYWYQHVSCSDSNNNIKALTRHEAVVVPRADKLQTKSNMAAHMLGIRSWQCCHFALVVLLSGRTVPLFINFIDFYTLKKFKIS